MIICKCLRIKVIKILTNSAEANVGLLCDIQTHLSTLQNVAVPVLSSTFNQFNYLCINIIRKEIFITFAERFSIFAFCSIISIQQPIMFQQFLLLCFEEMSWDNIFIRKLRLVKCISEVFLNNWYILRFFCKFHCSQQTFWYGVCHLYLNRGHHTIFFRRIVNEFETYLIDHVVYFTFRTTLNRMQIQMIPLAACNDTPWWITRLASTSAAHCCYCWVAPNTDPLRG